MTRPTTLLGLLLLWQGALGAPESGVPVEPPRNPYAAEAWTLPTAQPSLKPGPGAGVATAHCAQCHSVDYITTQPPLTRAQWTANVDKMRVRFGATVPTNIVPALVEYLTTTYGRP